MCACSIGVEARQLSRVLVYAKIKGKRKGDLEIGKQSRDLRQKSSTTSTLQSIGTANSVNSFPWLPLPSLQPYPLTKID